MTEPSFPPSARQPSLSVVVIGRNEGERLVRCLASVRTMHWPREKMELIYVDSASHDGSPARAADHGALVIEARPDRPCAAIGRNLGWRRATAPFILFLDGDTILHPDFVAQAMPTFADPRIAVVWGHRRELYPRASWYHRVLDLDWVYAPGPSLFCGGDALMRRSVLTDVGGYDEGLIAGEEPELCQRIRARGYIVQHVDLPMTQHDLAIFRWSQYWRRAQRAGYAYAAVADLTRRARPKNTRSDVASLDGLSGNTSSEKMAPAGMSPLWAPEARRNILHAACLGILGGFGLTSLLVAKSLLPLLLAFVGGGAIVLRSAYRARWKSANLVTLLSYGLHAHLQQIPIFLGQLNYWRDCWVDQERGLMEYKETRA